MGPSFRLDLARLQVIVATHRTQIDDREQFRIYGIAPADLCRFRRHLLGRLRAIPVVEDPPPDLAARRDVRGKAGHGWKPSCFDAGEASGFTSAQHEGSAGGGKNLSRRLFAQLPQRPSC